MAKKSKIEVPVPLREDEEPIEDENPRKKRPAHQKRTRKLAFRYWVRNGKNATKTSKELQERNGIKVSIVTITRWAKDDDWELKATVIDNQFKRMLRESDDPVLQQMAMDDVEYMKSLGQFRKILIAALGRPSMRRRLTPRDIKEAMALSKFLREEQEALLKRAEGQVAENNKAKGDTNITFNIDARKQELTANMESLPPAKRDFILGQIRGALPATVVDAARVDAFKEDEE